MGISSGLFSRDTQLRLLSVFGQRDLTQIGIRMHSSLRIRSQEHDEKVNRQPSECDGDNDDQHRERSDCFRHVDDRSARYCLETSSTTSKRNERERVSVG